MAAFHSNGIPQSSIPEPFVKSTALITGCVVCGKEDDLSRCAACKVACYCGREHQAADRPAHKAFCARIRKAQATLDKEETKLRNHPGDVMTPPNPFENCVGHFWGVHDTRDYMRARFAVVDAQMNKINTKQAVESSLNHLLDMLRLCRGDNMGVRDIIPGLYLRLGRDQECYDFCKWYTTTGQDVDYDWGDMDLGYLDVKNADVFETVGPWVGKWPGLAHMLGVTLLKIRLLIDLQSLERVRKEAGPRVPQEIFDEIRSHAVSSIVAQKKEIVESEDQSARIKLLRKQIKELFDAVKRANKSLWPAMLKPRGILESRPAFMVMGSEQEMQLKLQYYYNAFAETPGAIGIIEEMSKKK